MPYKDPSAKQAYMRRYLADYRRTPKALKIHAAAQRRARLRKKMAQCGVKTAEELRAYKAAWARRNWHKQKEKAREKQRKIRARYRAEIFPDLPPIPPVCECCGRPPNGRSKTLHLDHCHLTEKFRGWLCVNCNTGIGLLNDQPHLAVDYLRRAYSR